MNKRKILLTILVAASLLSACGGEKAEVEKDHSISTEAGQENPITVDGKEESSSESTEVKPDEKDQEDVSNQGTEGEQGEAEVSYLSPLTGQFVKDASILEKRPIAVMLDNHRAARWQAGVGEADIVYEFLAEGTITRYMAIFLENKPVRIGPVRSARPYFITKALEYDAVYTHCGGSEQAFADIKALGVADIDEIRNSGGAFYRYYKTGKKGEHTLYTDIDKIRSAQKQHKYRQEPKYDTFKFNLEDTDMASGDVANSVWIDYQRENITEYKYDAENKVYKRYKDGKLHVDENNQEPITAKNILIQRADTNTIDSYGRYSVKFVGTGKGYYVTNGKAIAVTWEKSDRRAKTIYKDSDGNVISLNPGKTWIQVIKLSTKMKIE